MQRMHLALQTSAPLSSQDWGRASRTHDTGQTATELELRTSQTKAEYQSDYYGFYYKITMNPAECDILSQDNAKVFSHFCFCFVNFKYPKFFISSMFFFHSACGW